jgi:multiple sugar transport system permease protein
MRETDVARPSEKSAQRETLRPGPAPWLKLSRRMMNGYFFVGPAILFLLVVSIFPLTRTLQMSLTDVQAGQIQFVGLGHYVALLQDEWFWNSLFNVAVFTGASVILHIFIGLGLALLLNETWFNTTVRNFMRGLLILPWVFSTAASGLMWTLLYHPFGLLNYLWVGVLGQDAPIEFLAKSGLAMASVVAVNTWKSYPFYMIIILGGLQGIPAELYEAAKVDGANAWKRFWHITLPQLRPILIAISTIDIITTFGHVDLIRMLTKGGPLRTTETVAYYIYKTALLDGNLGYGAAISTLMLAILAILIIAYLRLLSRGSEAGETNF